MPSGVTKNVVLANHTTLHVGGRAEYFVTVTSVEELREVLDFATNKKLSWRILGGGSNIVVPDVGVSGVVIKMAIAGIDAEVAGDTVLYTCGAGEELDACVAQAVTQGWWGLENLSHIPGTVGATPVQNVGAYGVEVADIIETVTVFDTLTGRIVTIAGDACGFGYRTSRFKTSDSERYIITAVQFRLSSRSAPVTTYADLRVLGTSPSLQTVREAVIDIRSRKFPDWTKVGTAGSFFKNPIVSDAVANQLRQEYPELPVYDADTMNKKISLGYLLDKVCGLKGYAERRVRLYEKQALVLVVEAGATATEVTNFAQKITDIVQTKTGIVIEREVQQW